jgi:hypothetical protein
VDSQKRACVKGFCAVRGFHDPDSLGEPIEKLEIVGLVSKESLTKVDVRLNESRKDRESGGVHDFGRARDFFGALGGDGLNPVFANMNIGSHDASLVVLCDQYRSQDPGFRPGFCHDLLDQAFA